MPGDSELFQRGRPAPQSPAEPVADTPAPEAEPAGKAEAGALPPTPTPTPTPAPTPAPTAPPTPEPEAIDADEVRRLGADLARAFQEGGYHPVVLFGTNFSGKTSLLLSLFATVLSEPELETGLVLCDPILGASSRVGKRLHREARHTFNVKTQAFIEGEKIAKTNVALPFFIPVEFRPAGKPAMRFAFLESNGEWYRPFRDREHSIAEREELFPELRGELEDFIASYQGGISFLYLIPATQNEVYADRDTNRDADEVLSASLAIAGVLAIYDRIRANHRGDDRHLMLMTKWDAHSARETDRAEAVEEDRETLTRFSKERYGRALTAFQGLNLEPGQRQLNAYCAGIINERGLLQLRGDDDLKQVVTRYPVRLWTWLYANALAATNQRIISPFPEQPKPPFLARLWNRILEFVSGR